MKKSRLFIIIGLVLVIVIGLGVLSFFETIDGYYYGINYARIKTNEKAYKNNIGAFSANCDDDRIVDFLIDENNIYIKIFNCKTMLFGRKYYRNETSKKIKISGLIVSEPNFIKESTPFKNPPIKWCLMENNSLEKDYNCYTFNLKGKKMYLYYEIIS